MVLRNVMKRIITYLTIGALIGSSVSCTTTYDANGNPRQSVTPIGAVAGAAVVGLIAYGLANDKDKKKKKPEPRGWVWDPVLKKWFYHE